MNGQLSQDGQYFFPEGWEVILAIINPTPILSLILYAPPHLFFVLIYCGYYHSVLIAMASAFVLANGWLVLCFFHHISETQAHLKSQTNKETNTHTHKKTMTDTQLQPKVVMRDLLQC